MLKCFSRSGTFFVTAQLSYSTGQFFWEINVLGGLGFFGLCVNLVLWSWCSSSTHKAGQVEN